jgi:glycosyltransferase involved in cell wall biosynthesis
MPVARDRWVTVGNDRFSIHYICQRPHTFRPKHGFLGRGMDAFSVERDALVRAMQAARPDVIHGHWSYEFGLAAIASGIPHVVTCHDAPDVVLKFMPNAYRFVRYLMGRQCLGKAKAVTAVSPYLQGAVQKYCRVPVAVVQNPLPDFLFSSDEVEKTTATKTGNKIAMVINGWGARKNPEPALRAFMQLHAGEFPKLELHLFGADFGSGEMAERWCLTNGSTAGMFFHGRTPHRKMLSQLRSMDLMLHPALEESCPMGIAEALSLGLPVIGGETSGGVPWVIGEGGVTVDVRSVQANANAIQALIKDSAKRSALAGLALKHAYNRFRACVVADMYEDAYNRAIEGQAHT